MSNHAKVLDKVVTTKEETAELTGAEEGTLVNPFCVGLGQNCPTFFKIITLAWTGVLPPHNSLTLSILMYI